MGLHGEPAFAEGIDTGVFFSGVYPGAFAACGVLAFEPGLGGDFGGEAAFAGTSAIGAGPLDFPASAFLGVVRGNGGHGFSPFMKTQRCYQTEFL